MEREVPLHELLKSVPENARLVIDSKDGMSTSSIPVGLYCKEAASALRQALAQREKPPVKTYCGGKPNYCTPVDAVNMSQERVDETAKREHEPVAWFIQYEYRHEFLWRKPNELEQKRALEIKPLYTAPPKKEWVGLTDDEVGAWPVWSPEIDAFVRNIEAKLKEKNT